MSVYDLVCTLCLLICSVRGFVFMQLENVISPSKTCNIWNFSCSLSWRRGCSKLLVEKCQIYCSIGCKEDFWLSRIHGHFIWGAIHMSDLCRNGVLSILSCYNFSKNCSYRCIIPVPVSMPVHPGLVVEVLFAVNIFEHWFTSTSL